MNYQTEFYIRRLESLIYRAYIHMCETGTPTAIARHYKLVLALDNIKFFQVIYESVDRWEVGRFNKAVKAAIRLNKYDYFVLIWTLALISAIVAIGGRL